MRKAKVKDTDCIINVMPKDTGGYIGSDGVTYKESQLDFLPEESPESATIEGWVAVDYNGLGYLFSEEPEYNLDLEKWFGGMFCKIPYKNLFPDMDCESEPRKVRITIAPIEE